ncbi:MAG: O-antigen ligase family protein [Victivallales bacterium]|nr:O-antigen ligase family protein [Victivallales bacterium]
MTAINFLTNPNYKGTALGFEISIIHLLAIALLVAMLFRRWPVKFLFPGIMLYILYFSICALSIYPSPNKLYSSFELVKMITLLITFLALTNYFYITHDFDSFIYGLSTLVVINFFIALEMKYLTGIVQVYGLFPHQNSMGMFMNLIGPIFLARVINKKDNLFKSVFFFVIFIMTFLSVLFTFSRGAIACFPLGCIIVIILTVIFHSTQKAFIILSVTGILGICAVIYCLPNLINRFTNASEASADTRKFFAETAINIIKDKPLLGCGLNTWGIVAMNPYYNPYVNHKYLVAKTEYMGLVETTYLLVGAECGLLGLAALLVWYFYYLLHAIYQSFRWRKTEYFYLLVGIGGGLTSNYLQSTLEWVLKQQINFFILFWCFGIIAVFIQGAREHTTLSYLELIPLRRAEYYRQQEIAAAAVAEKQMQSELQEQLEQPLDQPSDKSIE